MKEPWEWNEVDLMRLISDQVQESLTLDYKECDALQKTEGKKNEISKDVSAYANSAGGTIVYGIRENGHVPTAIDVGYDPDDIGKEWLDQVINSRIHRRIDGVRINQIQLSGSRAGKVIYVVSIPRSTRAPHMASDKRFYKRFNFESVPMEEYEVRDVSRRLIASDLYIALHLPANALLTEFLEGRSKTFPVEVVVGNSSPAPADFCLLSYYVDRRMNATCHGTADNAVEHAGLTIPVCTHVVEWRGNLRLPIWEGSRFQLGSFSIAIPADGDQFYLFWEAQAPLMNRKVGISVLRRVNLDVTVSESSGAWRLQKDMTIRV